MNTLTRNTKKAMRKAKEIATMRDEPVWLHITTMGSYFIDSIPEWWTPAEIVRRQLTREIVKPDKRFKVKTHKQLGLQ